MNGADEPAEVTTGMTCFVIAPIGNRHAPHGSPDRQTWEQSVRLMEEVIEPACDRVGLSAVRADSLARAGEINEQIFRRLRDDDVVIADLTGANANVMYELGLRHTREKLTVQIGEFSRLPFDVNTIRTIQFSPSPAGLITARDELIAVLEAGLSGDYDPVTATRVWNSGGSTPPDRSQDGAGQAGDLSATADRQQDERGFLDIMAEAEEHQDAVAPALEAVGESVGELGKLAEESTQEIARSDAAGRGMRGRLAVASRHAQGLDEIAERLETAVDRYTSVLGAFSDGVIALIERMENDPGALEEGREFGMITRGLARVTRGSTASLAEMVSSINDNARMSRVLREPSRRLTRALDRFTAATSRIDEWDRRLQSLGIPVPPPDWQPDAEDGEPTDGTSGAQTDEA